MKRSRIGIIVKQIDGIFLSRYVLKPLILMDILLTTISCGIGVLPEPDLAIYKTRSDYSANYNSQVNKHGKVTSVRQYYLGDNRICIYNEDTIYALRVHLIDGYVLSAEVTSSDAFTDLQIIEIVTNFEKGKRITLEKVESAISDRSPFTEFYKISSEDAFTYLDEFSQYPSPISKFLALGKRALEINKDIQEGTLNEKFQRIK